MSVRNISVAATGVVRIAGGMESEIVVNGVNLISKLESAIIGAHPKTDYHDQFAARVILTVELLGDLEESTHDD